MNMQQEGITVVPMIFIIGVNDGTVSDTNNTATIIQVLHVNLWKENSEEAGLQDPETRKPLNHLI